MVWLLLAEPDAAPSAAYRVAGRTILAPPALRSLRPFRHPPPRPLPDPPPEVVALPSGSPRSAVVVLGGELRTVELATGGGVQHVDLGTWGRLSVAGDGSVVDARGLSGDLPPGLYEELVLGPGLVLALAARGVWCLHGSAVAVSDGAVVFAGESGRGKSTLAARLQAAGFRRLADDVVPVELSSKGVEVLPAFPQLKLPADRQPSAGAAERLPLRAVYVLPGADGAPAVAGLAPAAAAGALLRHTVAARLFSAARLRAHLEAITALVDRVAVAELRLPLRWEALPAAVEAFAARHSPGT